MIIEGYVTDINNQPIDTAIHIYVQGRISSTGSIQNSSGRFRIENVRQGDRLVFSHQSYKEHITEPILEPTKNLMVFLEDGVNQLDEVVVTADAKPKKPPRVEATTNQNHQLGKAVKWIGISAVALIILGVAAYKSKNKVKKVNM